jgi:lipopolysaccharide export system permease protein
MKAISRYILNQLVFVVVFVAVGITFAVWLTQSLRLIDYIVNRGLPASSFILFVALLLPSFLGVVLPIATFCAVLFIYNKMLMDSELVVMRASGMSQIQLALPALVAGLGATAIGYAISLYFLPASFLTFKDLQSEIRNSYSAALVQEGVFSTLTDGITLYVRERGASGELRGILVHDNRDRERPVTMMAERGAMVQSEAGPRVVMINGNRQEVERESGRLSLLYFDRYTVEVAGFNETLKARWREPKERFLFDLLGPKTSKLDIQFSKELIAEGHQRLVAPFYTMTFVLIGLAALLSGQFNRRGQPWRVLAAILCVAALESASLALQDLATRSAMTLPFMYAAAVLPFLAGIFVLTRHPRRPRTGGQPTLMGVPS